MTEHDPVGPELGMISVNVETVDTALAVRGGIPSWLAGTLVRTGPAVWDAGRSQLRHWFDGLAMLHAFGIADGEVRYQNRFLDSRARGAVRDTGEIGYSEFATDPCRSVFQRVQSLFTSSGGGTDNGNVNIGRVGERFLAMTETAIPVEFDRRTLAAAGVAYRAPGQLSTAHPHYERGGGAMLNYAVKLGMRSSYRMFRYDAASDREPEVLATVPVREPAYMHSFGLTERWFVLAEFPLVVDPVKFAIAGKPFIENYRWRPERGTRFTLIDRRTGQVGARFDGDPVFAFHHVNAFEDGDDVVVDMCAYDDPGIIDELYLERLRGTMRDPASGNGLPHAHLTRFRLTAGVARAHAERITDQPIELPRVDEQHALEHPYRYVWGVGPGSSWWDRLVKIDIATGRYRVWSESDTYPSEPVFVPAPQARGEDDGAILSVVLDAASRSSFLLVLDAASLDELARAKVATPVPHTIHGRFAAEAVGSS